MYLEANRTRRMRPRLGRREDHQRAFNIGCLLVKHLDALELRSEESGGVQRLLDDHYTKIITALCHELRGFSASCVVRMSLFRRTCCDHEIRCR
jgi:hypothetical protein